MPLLHEKQYFVKSDKQFVDVSVLLLKLVFIFVMNFKFLVVECKAK